MVTKVVDNELDPPSGGGSNKIEWLPNKVRSTRRCSIGWCFMETFGIDVEPFRGAIEDNPRFVPSPKSNTAAACRKGATFYMVLRLPSWPDDEQWGEMGMYRDQTEEGRDTVIPIVYGTPTRWEGMSILYNGKRSKRIPTREGGVRELFRLWYKWSDARQTFKVPFPIDGLQLPATEFDWANRKWRQPGLMD
jgi:hypothetical protein